MIAVPWFVLVTTGSATKTGLTAAAELLAAPLLVSPDLLSPDLASFDICEFELARWISAEDDKVLDAFVAANGSGIADDLDGDLVYLARNEFYLGYTAERAPGIKFADVKDVKQAH